MLQLCRCTLIILRTIASHAFAPEAGNQFGNAAHCPATWGGRCRVWQRAAMDRLLLFFSPRVCASNSPNPMDLESFRSACSTPARRCQSWLPRGCYNRLVRCWETTPQARERPQRCWLVQHQAKNTALMTTARKIVNEECQM